LPTWMAFLAFRTRYTLILRRQNYYSSPRFSSFVTRPPTGI